MKIIKKKNEYLDKSRDVYNYVLKVQRLVKLLDTSRIKKFAAWGTIKRLVSSELSEIYNSRWIMRKNKRRDETISKIKKAIREFRTNIVREKKLLAKDMHKAENEFEVLRELERLPIFGHLTPQEKNILTTLVHEETRQYSNVYGHSEESARSKNTFRIVFEQLRMWVLSLDYQLALIKYVEDNLTNKQQIENVIVESDKKLALIFSRESKTIFDMEELLKKLTQEVQFVLDEIKRFEIEPFNPDDLKKAMFVLKDELNKHKNKVAFLQDFLKKQREIRAPLRIRYLIAVHMTNYFPENGVIRPRSHFLKDLFGDGQKVRLPRETTHFSLNGPVSLHTPSGDWGTKKFAILVPVPGIIDRIIDLGPQDAFVLGDLTLPKGTEVIIQNQKDLGEFQRRAGHVEVIVKKADETITKAVKRRIKERGYAYMSNDDWNMSLVESNKVSVEISQLLKDPDISEKAFSSWGSLCAELAQELNKELGGEFKNFRYEGIEANVELAYHFLSSDEEPKKEDLEKLMKDMIKVLQQIKIYRQKLKQKEEIDAFDRIVNVYRTLFTDLKKKFGYLLEES